jgi:hypothetical protein
MRHAFSRPVFHAECPRAGLRRHVHTPCEVVRERDFKRVGTRVLDLSSKGMLLESDLSILTGEQVLVSFRSPSGRWHDLDASVARVLHGRRRGDTHRAAAIAFDIDPFSELLLCEALRGEPVTKRHLAAHGLRARN